MYNLLFHVDHFSDEEDNFEPKQRLIRFADESDDVTTAVAADDDAIPAGMTRLQAMMLKMAGQNVPTKPQTTGGDSDDDEMDEDGSSGRQRPPGPPPG